MSSAEIQQEAQLSHRGRAMLRVCLYSQLQHTYNAFFYYQLLRLQIYWCIKFYYGLATRWWKIFEDIFIRFDATHERGRHTDRQTDGQTPHDSIGRAYASHRAAKTSSASREFRFIRGFYVSISIQNILNWNLHLNLKAPVFGQSRLHW